jgi:hypothetical protein
LKASGVPEKLSNKAAGKVCTARAQYGKFSLCS